MPEMTRGGEQLPPEIQQADQQMESATKGALGADVPQVVLPMEGVQEFAGALEEAKAALSGGQLPPLQAEVMEDGPMPPDIYAEALTMEQALAQVPEAKRHKFTAKDAASSPGGLTTATAVLRAAAQDQALIEALNPEGGEEPPMEEPPMEEPKGGKYDGLM